MNKRVRGLGQGGLWLPQRLPGCGHLIARSSLAAVFWECPVTAGESSIPEGMGSERCGSSRHVEDEDGEVV